MATNVQMNEKWTEAEASREESLAPPEYRGGRDGLGQCLDIEETHLTS